MSFSFTEEAALAAMISEDLYLLWKWAKKRRNFFGTPQWGGKVLTNSRAARYWWNMLCIRHKNRMIRFQLTRFFFYNDVPASLIRKWVMFGKRGEYDSAAWYDQDQLTKRCLGKTKIKFRGGNLLALNVGRVITFPDQGNMTVLG